MEPEYKAAPGLLDDTQPGHVTSVFATLNVVDRDNDVVLPGAFTDGQRVKMMWAHDWTKWIGDGQIRIKGKEAIFDGQFWLDTFEGEEAYKRVKRAGDLAEWSWGFFIPEGAARMGERDGRPVRFLGEKPLEIPEVSPVAVGAGINTRTTTIKTAVPATEPESGEKPFPNEHACRLKDPGAFQANSFRRTTRAHEGKRYSVIMGRLKGETTMTEQAFRYPKDTWSADDARAHCRSHDGLGFEAASDKGCESCGEHVPDLDIAELPYSEHLDVVLSDVTGIVTRSRDRRDFREEKEGRRLSAATRRHLAQLHEELTRIQADIDGLLAENEPPKDSLDPADLKARFARLEERFGVPM